MFARCSDVAEYVQAAGNAAHSAARAEHELQIFRRMNQLYVHLKEEPSAASSSLFPTIKEEVGKTQPPCMGSLSSMSLPLSRQLLWGAKGLPLIRQP